MTERHQPLPRAHFPLFRTIHTRWMDNDIYGHVNNVVHYSLFDTAVNGYLIEAGALDIHHGAVIGLVVQTQCHYFESIAFPQTVHAGLRVLHQGRSSVRYEPRHAPAGATAAASAGGLAPAAAPALNVDTESLAAVDAAITSRHPPVAGCARFLDPPGARAATDRRGALPPPCR